MRMKTLWLLALLLAVPFANAQTTKYLGSYPNATTPLTGTERGGFTQGSDPTSPTNSQIVDITPLQIAQYFAAQASGSCTISPAFVFTCTGGGGGGASNFGQLASGVNTTMAGVCSVGCSLTGNISASQINNVAVGINWTLTGTGSAGQLVPVTPTGCIGASNNQIFISCVQLPSYTIAGLPTCNASNDGLMAEVTNGQTSPTYLLAVSTTGAVHAKVFCNGTSWVYD